VVAALEPIATELEKAATELRPMATAEFAEAVENAPTAARWGQLVARGKSDRDEQVPCPAEFFAAERLWPSSSQNSGDAANPITLRH
jgi:hypothetical protein